MDFGFGTVCCLILYGLERVGVVAYRNNLNSDSAAKLSTAGCNHLSFSNTPTLPYSNYCAMPTIRQQMIELLSDEEMDARDLSRAVGVKEKEVYQHLGHIARSLAAKGRQLNIRPSKCLRCGYVFHDRKRFTRPGRCPSCRDSRLINPSFKII